MLPSVAGIHAGFWGSYADIVSASVNRRKPPAMASVPSLGAFLVSDALWQFCLFKPVFRDALN